MRFGITNRTSTKKYRVHRVWIIVEYRYHVESSGYGVCLSSVGRKWEMVRHLIGRVFRVLLKAAVAAWVTYIYAAWSIEQAYLQRGYIAYGGEYLFIPFVFYVVFKTIIFVEWTIHAVRQKIS